MWRNPKYISVYVKNHVTCKLLNKILLIKSQEIATEKGLKNYNHV